MYQSLIISIVWELLGTKYLLLEYVNTTVRNYHTNVQIYNLILPFQQVS